MSERGLSKANMCGLFNLPIVLLMGLVIIIFVSDPTFVSQPSSCPLPLGVFIESQKVAQVASCHHKNGLGVVVGT